MLGLLSVYTRLHASISAFLHLSPQFDLWSLWDWWESLRVSQIHGQFGSKFGSLQAGWPAEQHPRSSREEQLLSPNHLIIFEWCWSLVTYQTWINLLLKINWGQILIFVAFQMMSRGNVWETVLRGDTKIKEFQHENKKMCGLSWGTGPGFFRIPAVSCQAAHNCKALAFSWWHFFLFTLDSHCPSLFYIFICTLL